MSECGMCGLLTWRSTNKAKLNAVVYEPIGQHADDQCRRCFEALQRAPELVNWVSGVVAKLRLDIHRHLSTKKP